MSTPDFRRNMFAFLWHAVLLAITTTFTDINTVLPALILSVGGTSLHLGILTGIMVGVPLAGQLLFAGFLHTRRRKKPFLLAGIYLRIIALSLLTLIILRGAALPLNLLLTGVYGILMVFTLSGAFAGISYMDLVGKSFAGELRKSFIVRRQAIMSVGILVSALLTRLIMGRSEGSPYPLLFALSAFSLLTASGGFWFIRERRSSETSRKDAAPQSVRSILRRIPQLVGRDDNLRNYIIAANLLGFGTVLLPFYVALGKASYDLPPGMIGNLVLIQISGMILGNLIWHKVIEARGFKGMLFVWSAIGTLLPPAAAAMAIMLPFRVYLPLFIATGLYIGAQKVTSDAVLMEISTDDNRALYTGIFGTFNMSLALFPILMGGIISAVGFTPVFLFAAAAALAAQLFIRKMNCPVDR